MFDVVTTAAFNAWRDRKAVSIIAERIVRLSGGLFDDAEPVGEGVSELRVDFGPGYRIYSKQVGGTLIVLLVGGDKSSQRRDIAEAKALAADFPCPRAEET